MWKGDQDSADRPPPRPARPAMPAPAKPVPAQKKHLAHKPHEPLPGALKSRPAEAIKLARSHAHPIQRRPAVLTPPEKK